MARVYFDMIISKMRLGICIAIEMSEKSAAGRLVCAMTGAYFDVITFKMRLVMCIAVETPKKNMMRRHVCAMAWGFPLSGSMRKINAVLLKSSPPSKLSRCCSKYFSKYECHRANMRTLRINSDVVSLPRIGNWLGGGRRHCVNSTAQTRH